MYVFLQFVSTSVFLSVSREFWIFRGMKKWKITTVTSINQAYLVRTSFQTNAFLQYKIDKMLHHELAWVLPHLRWSKAFWSDMKKCQDRGQHDEKGSQEVVKTTSCQRTRRSLRHFVLSLPLCLLAGSALCPPSSACLVAKIWGGQATHGSWQLSEGWTFTWMCTSPWSCPQGIQGCWQG